MGVRFPAFRSSLRSLPTAAPSRGNDKEGFYGREVIVIRLMGVVDCNR
jgi:hypothetical protein